MNDSTTEVLLLRAKEFVELRRRQIEEANNLVSLVEVYLTEKKPNIETEIRKAIENFKIAKKLVTQN